MGGGNVVYEDPKGKPDHFRCSRIRYKLRSKLVDLRIMSFVSGSATSFARFNR
jgi:hypothetical protein